MKKQFIFSVSAVVLYLLVSNFNYATAQESLYKRLGGYDAIAAVSDEFIYCIGSSENGIFKN